MTGPEAPQTHKRARLWLWVSAGLIVVLAAFVGVARATDTSRFCNTCHEMQPFYTAWAAGAHGHAGVQCIDCHVKAGFFPRLTHKFAALGEVWSHFFGNRRFPLQVPPDLPNSWCSRCHPNVKTNLKNFVHAFHASKGTCRDCHPTAGHDVTSQALENAGIFNPNVIVTAFARKTAIVNGGRANVLGHVPVVCTRCHDMKATGCRACHAPPNTKPHQISSDCSLCHAAGRRFVFSHPGATVDCTPCHKPPARHPAQATGKACPVCHTSTWTFRHPGLSTQCLDCHDVPKTHPAIALGKACPACHTRVGRSWAFSHPSGGTDCSGCHTPPKNHFSGNCSNCHHRVGVSWVFAHPSAGEHSWRSFACVKCHSRGYTTAYCSCHGGNPPTGD